MMKFMSGLEGYIDQLETEAKEERRAKKLRDRQRIQTVSSDNDCDDWEDCSEDSDDTAFEKYYRKYVVNKDADETTSDDDGGDSDDSEQAKKNLEDYLRFMANYKHDSDASDDSDDSESKEFFREWAANQKYDSDDVGVDEDGRSFIVKSGYRWYEDGECEYEYDRAVYWDSDF